jgi:tetratricopeptide (TPR) repeat protein
MATGQAKTKAMELMADAAALAHAHPSEFQIQQLKRTAKSLLKQDAVSASDVLGFVAALEHDEAAMRSNYKRALDLKRGGAITYAHYAHALARLNFTAEARDELMRAVEIEPSNLEFLHAAIGAFIATGRISGALDLIERFNRLSPNKPSRFTQDVTNALAFIRANNLSESEIETLLEEARGVVRAAGADANRFNQSILSDEDSTWLNFDLILAEPVERVVELNTVLCRRLASFDPPLAAEDHVLVMYLTDDSA